jgi:hypothetical protein
MLPSQDAVNRHMMWTDPVMKFIGDSPGPGRIVGVVAEIDGENVVPGPALSVYHPLEQEIGGGRLVVHAPANPYGLVTPITRIIRDSSVGPGGGARRDAGGHPGRGVDAGPAEHRSFRRICGGGAGDRGDWGGGGLALSVSGRTREFGIRLAIGSEPRHPLTRVIGEGVVMAAAGVVAGAVCGYAAARLATGYFADLRMPGAAPAAGSAVVLLTAAVGAPVLPAARAARVDVAQALRSE